METAYLALDAHATSCVLGVMDQEGTSQGHERFKTAESELIPRIASIDADKKCLATEEGPLAFWISRTLAPYVDQVFVCDPKENSLISQSAHKSDQADVYSLCRLLRLGELKEVYHADEDHRAVFKAAARHYIDLRKELTALWSVWKNDTAYQPERFLGSG